jgi:branched-subunit amino acid aminotransferase/4-amino-4-deoxychorismate lyase
MSVLGDFYRLEAGELKPLLEFNNEVQLRVADSWLVEDGKVRSLPAHFERFANWVLAEDPTQEHQLKQFFAEVLRLLPRQGRWFPRMEYHGEEQQQQRLFLRLREAPQQIESVTLFTYPDPDPRVSPTIKGPDLSLCQQLRRHANMHGADEAVIIDSQGYVAEGALSALVWFRDDVLCSSDDSTNWLPSITRAEVFEIAKQMGLETAVERIKPQELANLPVWALSSLNGIMPVQSWVELNDHLPSSHHLEAFCKRLRLLSRQLD